MPEKSLGTLSDLEQWSQEITTLSSTLWGVEVVDCAELRTVFILPITELNNCDSPSLNSFGAANNGILTIMIQLAEQQIVHSSGNTSPMPIESGLNSL